MHDCVVCTGKLRGYAQIQNRLPARSLFWRIHSLLCICPELIVTASAVVAAQTGDQKDPDQPLAAIVVVVTAKDSVAAATTVTVAVAIAEQQKENDPKASAEAVSSSYTIIVTSAVCSS